MMKTDEIVNVETFERLEMLWKFITPQLNGSYFSSPRFDIQARR